MLVSGAVAKWLGNGLQNRHTSVRIRSAPLKNLVSLGGAARVAG